MSVQDTLDYDPQRARTRGAADTRPPPAWWEVHWDGVKAATEDAFHDVPGRAEELRNGELLAASAQLARDMGKDPTEYELMVPGEPGGNAPTLNSIAFWQDLAAHRKTHPGYMADLGADEADYDKRRLGTLQTQAQQRSEVMAKQGILGNLIGGAVGGFTDPINILTMPLGGGGATLAKETIGQAIWGVAKRAATEGAINAAVELGETPLRQLERVNTGGPDLTAGDVAFGVGSAFVGGAVFSAGLEGAGAGLGAARAKLDPNADARAMAAALRQHQPDYLLTPQQAAALHIIERDGQVSDASPYVNRYEENAAHAAKVDEFVRGWTKPIDETPPPGVPPKPKPRGPGALNAQILAGLRTHGLTEAQARGITAGIMAESRGDPTAFNPAGGGKGAYGIGQWRGDRLDKLRQRYGTDTPNLAQQIEFLVGELRGGDRGGAKVLGQGDEAAVLRSYIEDFMRPLKGPQTDNDISRGMDTLGREGEAPEAAPVDAEAEPIPRSPDLDAERPAMPIERADEPALPPQLAREQFASDDAWRVAQSASDAAHFGTEPHTTWETVLDQRRAELEPKLQAVLDDRRINLNNPDKLAARLGVDPELVRTALLDLSRQGRLDVLADGTGFVRHPPAAPEPAAPKPAKPIDALEFIASHGGIRDDEGHNLGLGHTAAELKGLSATAIKQARRNRKFGSPQIQTRTAKGPLLHSKGLTVDAAGELLHEAGYLAGADGGRPTEREVIDFLTERVRSGKPAYTREDLASAPAAGGFELPSRDEEIYYTRGLIADAAKEHFGVDHVDEDFLDYAAELKVDKRLEPHEAFAEAVNHYFDDVAWELHDGSTQFAGDLAGDWPFDDPEFGSQTGVDEAFLRRYEFDGGAAAEGEGGFGARASGQGEAGRQLSPAARDEAAANLEGGPPVPHETALQQFDEPGGEGTAAAADSIWHDIDTAEEIRAAREAAKREGAAKPPAAGAPPAEAPAAPTIISRETLGIGDGNFDVHGEELVQRIVEPVAAALERGDRVIFHVDKGKDVQIVRVEGRGMFDEKGQRWGTAPLLMPSAAKEHIRIEPAEAPGATESVTPPTLDLGEQVDPNLARKQAQELDIAAQQPLTGARKTGAAQDELMPEGLFAGAEAPTFDLGDGKGERTIADIAAELDADQAAIDTIKACLL